MSRPDPFDAVTQLPVELNTRAKVLLTKVERADDLEPILNPDYLIKGWIDRGSLAVLYGKSNSGKSFMAIDMAHCIQEGQRWAGHRVRQHAVLYVVAEGTAKFPNRLAARAARFHVLRHQITMTGRQSDAIALGQVIRQLELNHGERFGLVVIDTLARVMGGDENSAPDMGALVTACGKLIEATGAAVMLVHHSGKDPAAGARGHSSLVAAIDHEFKIIEADDGVRAIIGPKQRDDEQNSEIRFKLARVTLGTDADGDPVTSCIVQHEAREGALNL